MHSLTRISNCSLLPTFTLVDIICIWVEDLAWRHICVAQTCTINYQTNSSVLLFIKGQRSMCMYHPKGKFVDLYDRLPPRPDVARHVIVVSAPTYQKMSTNIPPRRYYVRTHTVLFFKIYAFEIGHQFRAWGIIRIGQDYMSSKYEQIPTSLF